MKNLYKFLVASVLFLYSAHQLSAQTYCKPVFCYSCASYGMTIVNFSTTGTCLPQISNQSVSCSCNSSSSCSDASSGYYNNYTYFSSLSSSGQPGSTVGYSITGGSAYPIIYRIWVDWNQDGTFDASESMSNGGTASGGSSNTTYTGSFTVPTNALIGKTRMRVISLYSYYALTAAYACAQYPTTSSTFYYGECQDYNFNVYTTNITPPLAGFAYNNATDTVWVNNPYIFVNTSNASQHNYWDIVSYSPTYNGTYTAYTPAATSRSCATRWNTCYLDTVNQNFTWRFPKVGYYKVKLKATNIVFSGTGNATGMDSVTKIVVCATPTQKPTASFFSVNTTVGFTDQLYYYDLSTNGPTAWSWFLNPNYIGINTYSGFPVANTFYDPTTGNALGSSSDTITQNPYLYAFDGGVFDVCLAVGNAMGWDTLCRHNYLTVNNGYMMCNGSDSVSTLSSGYVYDQNGPTGNYTGLTTGGCPAGFRITACADTVVLDIDRFKLYTGDSLIIRIGSPTGPVVRRLGAQLGGQSLPDALRHYRIPGGDVFLQMFAQNSSPGDSGFVIHWTTITPTYGIPKPSFTFTQNGPTVNGIPSVYKGYKVKYTNTSKGVHMSYSWDTNGDGIFGTTAGGDSLTASPSWVPNTPGLYNVCLKVYNCIGQDMACNKIRVLPLTNKPTADISVNKTSGFTSDTFRFLDVSTNGPTSWQWSFNPANVSFLAGTTSTSQNPIVFLNSTSCYSVTLTSTNSLGSNTKVVSCMVSVLGYNSPGTAFTIPAGSDIGISRVKLGAIDTTTALQTPVYTQMNDLQSAILYRGVDYTVTTYRQTNSDPMTTKVWIDFNMNASFGDANETIINEKSQNKITSSKTFRMPDTNPTGNTRMRVGITYDSTTLTPNMAQLGCFEDYGIFIGIDYIKPTIALKGPAVYKMQVGKTYSEFAVTATDNLEGDISSRYVRSGYLDVNTVGYYTLTYTVSDLYGNISDPITRIVQVEVNQTGPTISLNGKDTVQVGVNYNYTEQGATAFDNVGKNISNLIDITNNLNIQTLGAYSVVYSITDAFGFTATKTRTVMVVDTTKPVIKSINDKYLTDNVRSQIKTPFNYQNYLSVTDNYWKDLQLTQTGTIDITKAGSYTLKFDVTDGSGNKASSFRLIVKVDNTILPTITLNDLADLTVDVNTVFTDPGVTYNSTYYDWTTLVPNKTSNLDMTKIGTYTINYCISDPSGNQSCVSRTVHVVDRIAPVITLNGDDPYVLKRYKAYVDPGITITDNYYTESVLMDKAFLRADYSKVKNDVPGIYYVTFNVCDPSLNCANMVIRTVRVVDHLDGLNSLSISGNIKIYPNPNNGRFNVELENGTSVKSIKVYSIIGSLIKEISVNTNTKNIDVDMNDVNEGIYLVKIEGPSGSITQKINIVK